VQDPFQKLLLLLGEEHENQVSKLTGEIHKLKRYLAQQQDTFQQHQRHWRQAGFDPTDESVRLDSTDQSAHAGISVQLRELNAAQICTPTACQSLFGSEASGAPITHERAEGSPGQYVVREVWSALADGSHPVIMAKPLAPRAQIKNRSMTLFVTHRLFYQPPDSMCCLTWDAITLALLAYDMLLIPLFVFDLQSTMFTRVMSWVSQLFWNVDMLRSFFVGYFHEGILIMDPKCIVKHYLKTWFVFDLVVVSADWILFLLNTGLESTAGISRLGRSVKVFRVLRLLKLARVTKVAEKLEHMQDRICTESTNLYFWVGKLICRIAFMNHFIACVWYGIGKTSREHSWLKTYDMKQRSFLYRYTTSLHWAMAQLGVGVTSIEPQNGQERIFALFVLFSALILFGSLVGTITSVMQQIHTLNESRSRQFWLLRRFLAQHGVSNELSVRVKKFLLHAIEQHDRVLTLKDIDILEMLSEPLLAELQFERYKDAFDAQPFFRRVLKCGDLHDRFPVRVLHKVSKEAISSSWTAPGDVLFCAGDEATSAYFVKVGELAYARAIESVNIQEGRWISEASLWTCWKHQGHLLSTVTSVALKLNSQIFGDLISRHDSYWHFAQQYAARFVLLLNKQGGNRYSDLGPHLEWK